LIIGLPTDFLGYLNVAKSRLFFLNPLLEWG
jgi:hypothetical protein